MTQMLSPPSNFTLFVGGISFLMIISKAFDVAGIIHDVLMCVLLFAAMMKFYDEVR